MAILASAVVSLTVTPMLCSRFLKPMHSAQHGRVYLALEGFFEKMLAVYEWTLRWALGHQRTVLVVFIATVIGSGYLFTIVPKGFLPSGDSGQLIGFTEGAQDVSFQAMVLYQQQVADIIAADPNVMLVNSTVGAGGSRPSVNSGQLFIRLKPWGERTVKTEELIQILRPKTAGVTGIRVFIQNPPPINIGGQVSSGQYQYTLQDTSLGEVAEWGDKVYRRFQAISGLQDVSTNLNNKSLMLALDVDREKLAPLGLSMSQVQDALLSAFGTRQVSTIYGAANQYQVILELGPEFLADPNALSRVYVRSSNGRLVSLDTVSRVERRAQLLTVGHLGQLPSVTVSFNLAPGVALGTAVDQIKAVEREMGMPITVTGSLLGTAQAFQSSLQGMGMLLILAIVVIYLVLGVLYENFIHPLTILSGLPAAGVGALLTLLLFKVDLTLYAFVGIIMLIGIVKKNAIMMIDFAIARRRDSAISATEAIYQACVIRFRPIMMTTMAALAGTFPIAIGFGAGGDTRKPLGLAVVGGLVLSQLLTLYLTPVIYVWLDRLSERWSFRKQEPAASPGEPVAARSST